MDGVLTDTPTEEREEERRVARDLGRNLELEKSNRQTKDDHVDTDNEGLATRGGPGTLATARVFGRTLSMRSVV